MFKPTILTQILIYFMILGLSGCSSATIFPGQTLPAHPLHKPISETYANDPAFWQGNAKLIWSKLQPISGKKLAAGLNQTTDANSIGWIQLALISKRDSTDTVKLVRELLAWRERYPSHPGNALLPSNSSLNNLLTNPAPQHIGVILPLQGNLAAYSQMARDGIMNAYFGYLPQTNKQTINFYDTSQNADPAFAYQEAITKGADFVIGPLSKDHVQTLMRNNIKTPTLALNYTDSGSSPSNFYQFGLLPEDEVLQIAERAQQLGTGYAIVIVADTPWGKRMYSALKSQWQSLGGKIQDTYYFNSQANFNADIAHLMHIDMTQDRELMKKQNNMATLEQQRRHDFDVVFLLAEAQEARVIVPLLHYYYAGDIPVFATSAAFSGKPNPAKDEDLNGVTVCNTPWIISHARHNPAGSNEQWDNMYAVGRDAYLLSHEINRLIALPNFPIYGSTGALTLHGQQIHRRVPCVTIEHGTPA